MLELAHAASRRAAGKPNRIGHVGHVAQWESARFTRERAVVRNHPCPSSVSPLSEPIAADCEAAGKRVKIGPVGQIVGQSRSRSAANHALWNREVAPYRPLPTPVIVGTIEGRVCVAPSFGSKASLNDCNSQWVPVDRREFRVSECSSQQREVARSSWGSRPIADTSNCLRDSRDLRRSSPTAMANARTRSSTLDRVRRLVCVEKWNPSHRSVVCAIDQVAEKTTDDRLKNGR
jgi:hypothetical protein